MTYAMTLVVHDTTIYDRGTYVCWAKNEAGEAVLTVPVIIIAYTPRITTWPPPNVRALVGAPVQLSCAAIGIPKPERSTGSCRMGRFSLQRGRAAPRAASCSTLRGR